MTLWLARPGNVDQWTYDIVEREVLVMPELGPVETFRLKPRPIANPPASRGRGSRPGAARCPFRRGPHVIHPCHLQTIHVAGRELRER